MFRSRSALLSAFAAVSGIALWSSLRAHAVPQRSGPNPPATGVHVGNGVAGGIVEARTGGTPGQMLLKNKQGQDIGVCPLQHTDVRADIAGYVSRVNVTQEFANPSKEPIEAVYTFPLPEDAAVDDMTMQIGNRIVKGDIKRREEARRIYEAARSAGQTASLLDQERANIFTQSIANLMPGEKIRVTISYVNLLKYQEGIYEFSFPMVVGPRFVAGGGYAAPGVRGHDGPPVTEDDVTNAVENGSLKPLVRDGGKITPPITPQGTRAGHDISMSVHLDAGVPLQEVRSTLHAVTIARNGQTQADIQLKNQKEIPNKDFILRYTAAGSEIQEGILAYADGTREAEEERKRRGVKPETIASNPASGGGYFTMIIQPPLAPPKQEITPKEMVFVIDQTGSQNGWPIEKAKETMRHCIQNMNPDDTFQLLAFNTENHPCFAAPVRNTPANVEKAFAFLKPIQGNGGTDILKAADYALKMPDDPDRLRIVCYMTDGYVGNDMQIVDYIGKHRGRARMFPFGVGNSVNRFLIEGMAKEGKGASEYVTLNEPGEVAATRFYKRIASPLLLNPEIDWNGMPVAEVFPQHIPDVFSAGPIIVKGRYTRPGAGDVTLHGLLRGKPWQRTLHVVFPAASTAGSAIPTLWAREKIEDLQQQDWLGAQTGHPLEDVKEQMIDVALRYRLMSQYTSFVAVDQRIVNIGGRQRTVDVPVEMPEGLSYDGILGEEKLAEQLTSEKSMYFGATHMSLGRGESMQRSRGLGAVPGSGGFGGRGGIVAGKPAATLSPSNGPAGPSGGVKKSEARSGDKGDSGKDVAGGFLQGISPSDIYALDADNSLVLRYDDPKQIFDLIGDMQSVDQKAIANGDKEALAKLAKRKPAERRILLISAKLDIQLIRLVESMEKPGKNANLNNRGLPPLKIDKTLLPPVENDKVAVQIWLNTLPADGLAKLKTLGFDLAATLYPNKLLIGTLPVEKLDELVELGFVRRVEPPKFK